MRIRYNKLNPNVPNLRRYSEGAAAFDLYNLDKISTINQEQPIKIKTGISIEIPHGFFGRIENRSGCADNIWIIPSIIDSDYRGEIHIIGFFRENQIMEPLQRIAQLVIMPCFTGELIQARILSRTLRNDKGFGSTGK